MTKSEIVMEAAREEYAAKGVLSLTTQVALAEAGLIVDEVFFHLEEEKKHG